MILAAGLTPAWQQILAFVRFSPGEVNRAYDATWCASGKVLNVALALRRLGGPASTIAPVGGVAGEAIREQFQQMGISARWIQCDRQTRTCTTILDRQSRQATELVPEASPLAPAERDEFFRAYREMVPSASVVVLIGSLPAGTPTSFYHELAAVTPGKLVLDARGPELLAALAARPFLIKPNREELEKTIGQHLSTEAELWQAMRHLNQQGAAWVVITDSQQPVRVSSVDARYRFTPPRREVVNPIGCGDCMAAGIAWATAQGRDPLDAIRLGLAVAAEKLGRMTIPDIDPTGLEALAAAITLERVQWP
jgi:1-phosphofructokinase family hexose kinase